ncbi:hypothetical protein GGI35DRAFT_473178 [Trichoderma velutinum]
MARSLALLAFSSAVMAAQSTTVSLLLPFADPQPLVGSVIAVGSAATTYAYGCPSENADDCGFIGSQTVTQGPSTWDYTMTYSDEGEGSLVTEGGNCKLFTANDSASCSMFFAQEAGSSATSTARTGVQPFLTFQLPVTITAGLEKLKATPGATATDGSTAAPTNTGASQAAPSGSSSTTLARQTSAASTGNSTRTATSTAGPHSTNAAGIINAQNGLLAGVAALVGGAMML